MQGHLTENKMTTTTVFGNLLLCSPKEPEFLEAFKAKKLGPLYSQCIWLARKQSGGREKAKARNHEQQGSCAPLQSD